MKKPPAEVSAVRRATGRDRADWFSLLDDWGAAGRPHGVIANRLTAEHHISRWWAQKLIVEYEQARGVRAPGVRRDGTFTITASKSIAVPVGVLFDAFLDMKVRERWLPGVVLKERTSTRRRLARFDWGDTSRVNVTFRA